jgi:hypothetical protein
MAVIAKEMKKYLKKSEAESPLARAHNALIIVKNYTIRVTGRFGVDKIA